MIQSLHQSTNQTSTQKDHNIHNVCWNFLICLCKIEKVVVCHYIHFLSRSKWKQSGLFLFASDWLLLKITSLPSHTYGDLLLASHIWSICYWCYKLKTFIRDISSKSSRIQFHIRQQAVLIHLPLVNVAGSTGLLKYTLSLYYLEDVKPKLILSRWNAPPHNTPKKTQGQIEKNKGCVLLVLSCWLTSTLVLTHSHTLIQE